MLLNLLVYAWLELEIIHIENSSDKILGLCFT